jgi:hypothetical protein
MIIVVLFAQVASNEFVRTWKEAPMAEVEILTWYLHRETRNCYEKLARAVVFMA